MKLDQLVALIIRLFAVYFSLTVFFQSVGSFAAAAIEMDAFVRTFVIGQAIQLGAMAAMLALLWRFPLFLARRIIPKGKDSLVRLTVTADELQTLGFSFIGFYVLLDSFLDIVSNVVFAHKEHGGLSMEVHFTSDVVRFIVGFLILFGARGFTRAVKRLRGE